MNPLIETNTYNNNTHPQCYFCHFNPFSPKSLITCYFCDNPFCNQHILKTRPEPNNPERLQPICEKCERNLLIKTIYEDFTLEKSGLDLEIKDLKARKSLIDSEFLMKKDALEGIQRSKRLFIEKLTNEALGYGQEIEQISHENKTIEKELQNKLLEQEKLDQEIEGTEFLIKELLVNSPEETSPTGYGYIWDHGLLLKKQENEEGNKKKKDWKGEGEGFCGCLINALKGKC